MKSEVQQIVDIIKADDVLYRWARYSIRYNTKCNWGQDFIDKLKYNNVHIKGDDNIKAIKQALDKIDKDDRDN